MAWLKLEEKGKARKHSRWGVRDERQTANRKYTLTALNNDALKEIELTWRG